MALSPLSVKEVYESEVAPHLASSSSTEKHSGGGGGGGGAAVSSNFTSPIAAVLFFFDSFLATFDHVLQRVTSPSLSLPLLRNHALNKLVHFYYERIACANTDHTGSSSSSSSNTEHSLDAYHLLLSRRAGAWFDERFEPDHQTVHALAELCSTPSSCASSKSLKFVAYELTARLHLGRICESYFRRVDVSPAHINDFLKCLLQLLAECCVRDSVRESSQFEPLLRPVYNQTEILACWSMLTDASYAQVVLDRFALHADHRYAFASRGTDRGLLMNVLKSAAEFYAFEDSASSACVSVSEAGRSCFASVKRRYYLRALCTVLLKPTAHIIQSDLETFHTCVLNLLTDIETLALSSSSSDVHAHTGVADNEIALLVDECLALLSSTRNPQASLLYRAMFESWIGSSKDSPILLSLISRLSSHTTLLLAASTSETYFGLLELCLEVFFETSRPSEQTWHLIISNVHLIGLSSSSSSPSDETSEPFELSCLQHSAYLLLHAYMCVHLNDWQAKVASSASSINSLLDYSMQIINAFLVVDAATKAPRSRPKAAAGKEAKFIVILKKLVHTLLVVMQHATQFAYANQLTIQEQRQIESRVGEQIVKLANLLVYYGEDTLSSQSPLNSQDGRSLMGAADLLTSIGLNILAKHSPYALEFRFYCRCMAICLLKLVIHEREQSSSDDNTSAYDSMSSQWHYRVKMSGLEQQAVATQPTDDSPNKAQSATTTNLNKLSSSATSSSFLSSFTLSPPSAAKATVSSYALTASYANSSAAFDKLFKQTALQFHLIFQTKAYFNNATFVQLGNQVNQCLQGASTLGLLCLPHIDEISELLCAKLFDKQQHQYLF